DQLIATFTKINMVDIRDWLITLEDDGLVSVIRSRDGLRVCLKPKGQVELLEHRVGLSQAKGGLPDIDRAIIRPKGLRSFDEQDADYFHHLLPGPRRSDGLPESIHFWKIRIEERDPEKTFSVGVIFGPSGSGKTSL